MEMEAIELTVHSCKDLKGFNFFQKMSVYVQVWVGNPKKGQKTPPDRENDRNPEWKHRMRFELDESADKLALDFDIRKEGALGDTSLGRVHVPVVGLLEDYTGGVRYVCYQVKASNDEATGLLNFSYRFEGMDNGSFHRTNPEQDAAKLNPIGSAGSGWYQAPSAPTVVSETFSAATPSIVYPTVESYYPPQIPHSAPYPSDQPPPTSSFGTYQLETSCMEAHQAPIKPPSAPYLPIPAQAAGHHAPPSLQAWPFHPSELTAPINQEWSAAQPPLVLPPFPPPFPPPPPPPPALPFPPPPHPHHYYHHPPPPPPRDQPFRPGPFGFAPHDPRYWR